MNAINFEKLCRDASEQLGLADTTALGNGVGVSFDDLVFEAGHVAGEDALLLLADLGPIEPDERGSIYESLLAMESQACREPQVRFGFHPMHEAPVLCMGAALSTETNGAWLASLLKSVSRQVHAWRRERRAATPSPRQVLRPSVQRATC